MEPTTCRICGDKVDEANVAVWLAGDDRAGQIRRDSNGHVWCQKCSDEFDAIDPDKE